MLENMNRKIRGVYSSFILKLRKIGNHKEQGSHLVEVLGVIVIAIILLIIFRDEIIGIWNTAINSLSDGANNIFTITTNTGTN